MKFTIIIIILIFHFCLVLASDELNENLSPNFVSNESPTQLNIADYPDISIKFNGNDKSISCKLDTKSKMYICPNSKNKILVKYGFMGFIGLGRDESGSPKIIRVTSVVANKKTLFETPQINFYGGEGTTKATLNLTKDLNREYSKRVSTVEQFLMNIEYGADATKKVHVIQGSEEFEKVAKSYLDEMKVFQDNYNKIRRENIYKVELADGSKIKCVRGQTRSLSPEEIAFENKLGTFIQCSSFKCDDIIKEGKRFKTLMLFDSNPGSMISSTLHLFDNSGIGPEVTIKNISSTLSPTPLLDNSFFISHPIESNSVGNFNLKHALPQSLKQNSNNISLYKDPSFIQFIDYNKNKCTNSDLIDSFSAAKAKLNAKLADAELVQYIELLSDNSLRSNFINPNEALKLGCFYNGIYLNSDAAKNLDKINKNLFPDKHIDQTITLEKANSLFKEASEMNDIAWKYKQDGCYARAHLMARRFEAEGVRVDKVWIKGDLYIPETEPLIKWGFHVAPIVYVKSESGEIQKMVIDPSLFDHPVSVSEWDQKISKNTIRGSVVTAFPFPENAAIMERSAISFSSSNPYLPDEDTRLTEDQKIKMANEIMKQYKQLEPK